MAKKKQQPTQEKLTLVFGGEEILKTSLIDALKFRDYDHYNTVFESDDDLQEIVKVCVEKGEDLAYLEGEDLEEAFKSSVEAGLNKVAIGDLFNLMDYEIQSNLDRSACSLSKAHESVLNLVIESNDRHWQERTSLIYENMNATLESLDLFLDSIGDEKFSYNESISITQVVDSLRKTLVKRKSK